MRFSALILVLGPAALAAQARDSVHVSRPMTLYPAGAVEWKTGPASLPAGVQGAILEGDPTKPGLFTMRLKFPAGMRVMPHFHSETEHATVLAGTLHIGMGERFDSAATTPLPAGSYGFWLKGTRHFAWMEGETVLQVQGMGPWTITYVNPADDPRSKH